MANSPTLHTVPARPSAHAPYTLRTRSAHALHSRAGSQPARLRGLPLARLTQLMRGHGGTSLRQIKCTLGTALPRRAPPLSLSLVAYVCIVRALPSGDARRAGFCCRAPSTPPRGQGCFQLRGKRQPSRASARLPLSFGVTANRVQWPAASGARAGTPPSGIGSPSGSLEHPAPGEVPAYSQEAEDDRRERGSVSRAVSRMS